MTPCGFALLCKLVGEAPEVIGVAAGSEGSVDMPGEAVVGDPIDPGAPDGPAGPETGTVTTAAGFTTVGLSHALKASAISIAENTIEYFMRIPFSRLTKTTQRRQPPNYQSARAVPYLP
jgi:hypothetical protein